jgi:hypothetical protein
VQNFGPPAPVGRQVQKLEVGLRQIISGKACDCQVKKFIVEQFCRFLYNYYINRRQCKMTDTEFFAQIQEDWFHEFAGAELSEIFVCTNTHDEKFEFDDVPF